MDLAEISTDVLEYSILRVSLAITNERFDWLTRAKYFTGTCSHNASEAFADYWVVIPVATTTFLACILLKIHAIILNNWIKVYDYILTIDDEVK